MTAYRFTFLNLLASKHGSKDPNQLEELTKQWMSEHRSFDAVISSPVPAPLETAEHLSTVLESSLKIITSWQTPPGSRTDWHTYLHAGATLQSLFSLPPGKYLIVPQPQLLRFILAAIFGGIPTAAAHQPNFLLTKYTTITLDFEPKETRWHVREIAQPPDYHPPALSPAEYHITFVRHGESLGNLQRLFQGQKEYPLSDAGRQQAHTLAETLSKNGRAYQKIITSPQERALETAQIIADKLSLEPDIEPLWKEVDNGLLAGLTREEADELQINRDDLTNPYIPLGQHGESWWELYFRSGKALHNLLKNPPGSYLVVAHGGVLNAALWSILGLAPQPGGFTPTFQLKNTSPTALRFNSATQRWLFLSLSKTPLP